MSGASLAVDRTGSIVAQGLSTYLVAQLGFFWRLLAFDERQQLGIDRVRLGSGHPVREVLESLQGCVLQQLS